MSAAFSAGGPRLAEPLWAGLVLGDARPRRAGGVPRREPSRRDPGAGGAAGVVARNGSARSQADWGSTRTVSSDGLEVRSPRRLRWAPGAPWAPLSSGLKGKTRGSRLERLRTTSLLPQPGSPTTRSAASVRDGTGSDSGPELDRTDAPPCGRLSGDPTSCPGVVATRAYGLG